MLKEKLKKLLEEHVKAKNNKVLAFQDAFAQLMALCDEQKVPLDIVHEGAVSQYEQERRKRA